MEEKEKCVKVQSKRIDSPPVINLGHQLTVLEPQ